jgi:hypothetical protein
MKKLLFILSLFILLSCVRGLLWINYEDLIKVRVGMHYNEVQTILNNQLDVDEIDSDDLIVGLNYFSQSGIKQTVWLHFNRNDSILNNMW